MPEVLEKHVLMLRNHVGTAKDPKSGEEYTMTTTMSYAPIIELPDGRKVVWSWEELIDEAIKTTKKES